MYLSRLTLNQTVRAQMWASNAYRVHQRLMMACDGDRRLLFRVDVGAAGRAERPVSILVQSNVAPNWTVAFDDNFAVLGRPPESRPYEPALEFGIRYRFRLLANPIVCRSQTDKDRGRRIGLLREDEQRSWLDRKFVAAGLEPLAVTLLDLGMIRSQKGDSSSFQTHLAVRFDGVARCLDATLVSAACAAGIGPAKGYGFGLLSLARIS